MTTTSSPLPPELATWVAQWSDAQLFHHKRLKKALDSLDKGEAQAALKAGATWRGVSALNRGRFVPLNVAKKIAAKIRERDAQTPTFPSEDELKQKTKDIEAWSRRCAHWVKWGLADVQHVQESTPSDRHELLEMLVKMGNAKALQAALATPGFEQPSLVKQESRTTLLHMAAALGRNKCLKLLLAHGWDVMRLNMDGKNAAHMAASSRQALSMKVLAVHGNPDVLLALDNSGRTPLQSYEVLVSREESHKVWHAVLAQLAQEQQEKLLQQWESQGGPPSKTPKAVKSRF